jgi:ubiquitin carboxyl-terminal hydrolase 34
MYRLMGVLVHSGGAESGHYYSYVRERNGEEAR